MINLSKATIIIDWANLGDSGLARLCAEPEQEATELRLGKKVSNVGWDQITPDGIRILLKNNWHSLTFLGLGIYFIIKKATALATMGASILAWLFSLPSQKSI